MRLPSSHLIARGKPNPPSKIDFTEINNDSAFNPSKSYRKNHYPNPSSKDALKTSCFDIQFLGLTEQTNWGAQCLLCFGFTSDNAFCFLLLNHLAEITGFKWLPQGF